MALIDFMSCDTLVFTAGYTPANWVLPSVELSRLSTGKTGSYSGFTEDDNGTARRDLTAAEENATIIVGYWVQVDTYTAQAQLLKLNSDADATRHITYTLETDGTINARRGTESGTILDGGMSDLVVDTWRHIEFKTVLSDTVGSVACRVDGVELFSATGLDTKNGGTKTVFDAVHLPLPTNAAYSVTWDDWFVVNGDSASAPSDWVGGARVYSAVPSGNGNSSGFTGSDGNSTDNYLLVDEANFAPGTDYVSATADSLVDLYAMGDVTLPTGAEPLGVKASVIAVNSSTGDRTIALGVRSGGTDDFGTAQTLNTSARIYERVMALNPVTASAWTAAEVNALEAGYRSGS